LGLGGAVDVARVGEQVGRAPQQLDAGPLLVLRERVDHDVEVLVALGERRPLGSHVAVVEAVEADAELLHELEGHVGPLHGHLQRVGVVLPRAEHGAGAERVGAGATEGVPVGDGEPEVVLHRLPLDERVGVVVAEGEHARGLRTLVLDPADARERLVCRCHLSLPWEGGMIVFGHQI
jgi:hypothetical protein